MPIDRYQSRLDAVYESWKGALSRDSSALGDMSAPLLVAVPESYEQPTRIVVVGQETKGWGSRDTHSWPKFVNRPDSIAQLTAGYQEFGFAQGSPVNRGSPFWRAVRQIDSWEGVGLVWTNLVRADYEGRSFLKAPEEVQQALLIEQADLLAQEFGVLEPDAVIFFTGPDYDPVLRSQFRGAEFLSVGDLPTRQFSRIKHDSLRSYRLYHPNYLQRGQHWEHLSVLRNEVMEKI